MSLEGQVIIITGASSGIGKATAGVLSRTGMKCVLTGRSVEKLESLAATLGEAAVCAGDITDPQLPERLIASAQERFGRLDALFNNVGIMNIGSVEDADIEALCHMIRVNYEALVRMSYHVLRFFRKQGRGFLINTSSLAGLKTFPRFGVYNGTKFAVEALTDSLRMEMAGTGVRVAAVAPGRTRTHLFDHWPEDQKFDPADGMLDPEAIANAVRFVLEQPEDVVIPRMLVMPSRQPT